MRKNSYFSFIFTFVLLFAVSVFAQEKQDVANLRGLNLDYIVKTRVINPQPINHVAVKGELYNNGAFVNVPGGGANGADASTVQENLGFTGYGSGWQKASNLSLADDLTISGASWTVDSIKFYGYQTGSTLASTYTGVYVKVYDGDPRSGGQVIWGDFTTNRLLNTYWTGAYRTLSSALTNADRPIMAVVANTSGLTLQPGSYWIEFTAEGTLTSGPWMPPITITGQAVTGNAIQFDAAEGTWTEIFDNTTDAQGMPFTIFGSTGAPVGPGPATNPTPANGALGLATTGIVATWTNPANVTNVKVYFSDDMTKVQTMDASAKVYDGAAVTTFNVPDLTYFTNYYWRVVETDATGSSNGSVWSFKTMRDPSAFFEDFEAGTDAWTITGTAPYVWTAYTTWPNTYTLPSGAGAVLSADSDEWGSSAPAGSTTATLSTGVNMTTASVVTLEFDSDFRVYQSSQDQAWCDVSVDGGTNWTNVYYVIGADDRNAHKVYDISGIAAGQSDVRVRFTYANTDWNYFWAIDNVTIYGNGEVPVELTNFAANVINNQVVLNWATATETNNSGFAIERSADNSSFTQVAFVDGFGTTTEKHVYSYTDASVLSGTFTYRLKQVDYDGTVSYSNAVEVTVGLPVEFSMDQNYPNPFNPTTTIRFALPTDSHVAINVYNALGQQVANIVNSNYAAGSHEFNFNASSLSSGVYFYTIEAKGMNGQNFVSTKKMALMK